MWTWPPAAGHPAAARTGRGDHALPVLPGQAPRRGRVARPRDAAAERTDQWGEAYVDHGLLFAREDGNPLALDAVTKRFRELEKEAGLRPVRLHDLRHGAASLRLAAGTDIAIVSKVLGHSSVSITSDTYSPLLAGVDRAAAEKAALVPETGVTSR
jgi:integrase